MCDESREHRGGSVLSRGEQWKAVVPALGPSYRCTQRSVGAHDLAIHHDTEPQSKVITTVALSYIVTPASGTTWFEVGHRVRTRLPIALRTKPVSRVSEILGDTSCVLSRSSSEDSPQTGIPSYRRHQGSSVGSRCQQSHEEVVAAVSSGAHLRARLPRLACDCRMLHQSRHKSHHSFSAQ